MRIELVVDVPGIHNPNAVDAINYGNEVVRLVRNDTGDNTASLIHAAVGSDIAVPSDFTEGHPVVTVEPTDIVHDPSAITPHNENVDSNTSVSPSNVDAPVVDPAADAAEAAVVDAPVSEAVTPAADVAAPAADAPAVEVNPEADAALQLIAPPVETPEEAARDQLGTKD